MLHPLGRKLYLAMKDLHPVGIFSSAEKAQASSPDSISEIEPLLLEGSPCSGQYACMAAGSSSLLRREGDSFRTDLIDLGPVWGANPQSALMALVRSAGRSLSCSELRLFQIDQIYEPGEPLSLHEDPLFSSLIDKIRYAELLKGDALLVDYISLHHERQRIAAAAAAKASLPEVEQITSCLMRIACQRATADGGSIRCGTPLISQRRRLRIAILDEFSIPELKELAPLLNPDKPAGEACPLSPGEADLLRRAAQHIPHIINNSRSKRLKDYLD